MNTRIVLTTNKAHIPLVRMPIYPTKKQVRNELPLFFCSTNWNCSDNEHSHKGNDNIMDMNVMNMKQTVERAKKGELLHYRLFVSDGLDWTGKQRPKPSPC